jgi:peroxiredoxin
MKTLLAFGIVLLALATYADDDEPELRAGHSAHGEAFNEGPRQAAYLMEGMPDIDFPVTTTSPEAQKFFNQGVGQLHGFWYFEAERSFRQVAALDTNCAMALWGMAMANTSNEKRAKGFIDKAVKMTNDLSRHECLYIESLAKFYKKTDDRHRQYIRDLEQLLEEFPDDVEAKAFLVFKIWENNGRQKISSFTAAHALAREVLDAKPMHPIHHALIHLWNNEADRRALTAAAKCGQGSPGIAHMWHMPGHTYSALHRYADAAWQQEASARVDHAYMIRNRVLPDQIHNYAHNNEWLIKNLSYLGRVRDAIDLAKNLVELPRHPKFNSLGRSQPSDSSTNSPSDYVIPPNSRGQNSTIFGRRQLCDVMVRWELWDDLIRLGSTMYLERTDVPEEQARRAEALGVAHFSKGDRANGETQIAALESALKQQKESRREDMEAAETKARKDKKSDSDVTKAMTEAIEKHASKIKSMESSIAELKLYQLIAAGETNDALKQIKDVKDIPNERLAQLYLKLGETDKAIERAESALKSSTNQVQVLANYVDILSRCDKGDDADKEFERLRTLACYADLDLPIFARLKPFERTKPKPATDIGERPPLERLGPFRWSPSPAPDWTLRDSDEKKVSLKDFRGHPVLVLFYLGHGCVHCLEQLNLLAPMAAQYQSAGISIVAISTDSIEGLKKTLEKSKSADGFPFHIVSNEKLDIFKAYRAYDDFEKMPLHGTFLVDGQGLVRWQDISYEPFNEPEFLLKEAQRLLKLPTAPLLTQKKPLRSPKASDL